MRYYNFIIAFICLGVGIYSLVVGDLESARFFIIMQMLFIVLWRLDKLEMKS